MQTSLHSQLLNFRKMKHDFPSAVLREAKDIHDRNCCEKASIVQLSNKSISVSAQIKGNFSKTYSCSVEIDRNESEIVDSKCSCANGYDCVHLCSLVLFLEKEIENLIVTYFQKDEKKDVEDKNEKVADVQQLEKVLQHAQKKVQAKKEKEEEKQLIEDYVYASNLLGRSSFFVPEEKREKDLAEIFFAFVPVGTMPIKQVELHIGLRLPSRPKPTYISQLKPFFSALELQEPFYFANSNHLFGFDSFGPMAEHVLRVLRQHIHFVDTKDKSIKGCLLDKEGLGEVLAAAYEWIENNNSRNEKNKIAIPNMFWGTQETVLEFCMQKVHLACALEKIKEPFVRILLAPKLFCMDQELKLQDAVLFDCSRPGFFLNGTFYRFVPEIRRTHISDIERIERIAIPEPLFGSFIENGLPELRKNIQILNPRIVDDVITLPFVETLNARCDLEYVEGELDAKLFFKYGKNVIPEHHHSLKIEHIQPFVSKDGIFARNLSDEQKLLKDLFEGFEYNEKDGCFTTTSEKKIVEFMTEIVPAFRNTVDFITPETLQSRFVYDDTTFTLELSQAEQFDRIKVDFIVNGDLKGIPLDLLWECVETKKSYLVSSKKSSKKNDPQANKTRKILVLKLAVITELLQIFDELQISVLENTSFEIPLWMLVNLVEERFQNLPLTLKLSQALQEIQTQIFSQEIEDAPKLPKAVSVELRHYQKDGVNWLFRLRNMGVNGILADDMGLGKTIQAIVAIAQYREFMEKEKKKRDLPKQTLIVCPTSLVDNWKEEFSQFAPSLKVTTIQGTPNERKKLLQQLDDYDVLVTSYGLVQKDIEIYEQHSFGYLILDEAQHIKNRETRNARSVKKIPSRHKLILTGTPLENSLEDLWSLFDFLMPGLLGSFDRFSSMYIRQGSQALEVLKKKITPFVLRRMKQDVLEDLPPISHLVYHCHLSSKQHELYASYAKSAKENLMKLVEKEGFDKVRIHVLATLTRLKQICCHPAIFAKDQIEDNDSAKYEMLLDLLGSLVEAKHKTVVFSQYTKMLEIMRKDLEKMNIPFCYLDGSSKNRLQIVKQFNEDKNIPIFLVSLKAGGTGLNLVGADTVIHYDMWWNPAVENQATDRVWRLGQKQKVCAYKLITMGTIEEKILQLQEKKKELLHDIVQTDEEGLAKLTWEEVLELLKVNY